MYISFISSLPWNTIVFVNFQALIKFKVCINIVLTYNKKFRWIYAHPLKHCSARHCSQFGHAVATVISLTIERTRMWVPQSDTSKSNYYKISHEIIEKNKIEKIKNCWKNNAVNIENKTIVGQPTFYRKFLRSSRYRQLAKSDILAARRSTFRDNK